MNFKSTATAALAKIYASRIGDDAILFPGETSELSIRGKFKDVSKSAAIGSLDSSLSAISFDTLIEYLPEGFAAGSRLKIDSEFYVVTNKPHDEANAGTGKVTLVLRWDGEE